MRTFFHHSLFNIQVLHSLQSIATSSQALGQNNPHWDDVTASVYFVDIFGEQLFCYSLRENRLYTITVNGVRNPSFFIPIAGSHNRYLVGSKEKAVAIIWDGHSTTGHLDQIIFFITPGTSISSAYTSSFGELFVGSLASNYCATLPTLSLYRYTIGSGLVEVASHFRSTTGVIMTNDTLYHLDGCSQVLSAFDRDSETGQLSRSCSSKMN